MRVVVLLCALIGCVCPAQAGSFWAADVSNDAINLYDSVGGLMDSLPIGFQAGAIEYSDITDKLYFGRYNGGTSSDNGVWSMNSDGTGLTQIFTATGTARSVGLDPVNGYVFADIQSGADDGIWRMELDGSNPVKIDDTFVSLSIGALKPDPLTQTLYIGDWTGGNVLKSMDYAGGSQTTVLSGLDGNLHEIDLDPINGKLYMASNGAGPIYRMNLDGTGLETFADGFTNPVGLALDLVDGYVYVGELSSSGGVERLNLDGTGRTQIVSDIRAFGLAYNSPIPEPTTAAILTLCGMGLLKRRAPKA